MTQFFAVILTVDLTSYGRVCESLFQTEMGRFKNYIIFNRIYPSALKYAIYMSIICLCYPLTQP